MQQTLRVRRGVEVKYERYFSSGLRLHATDKYARLLRFYERERCFAFAFECGITCVPLAINKINFRAFFHGAILMANKVLNFKND